MLQSDYVPRRYHEQQITALTDRSVLAEQCVTDLLTLIDPTSLQRHAGDWLAAVKELLA